MGTKSLPLGRGGYLPIPPSRAFISDYLHFAARVPSHPLVRMCNLKRVDELRKSGPITIGWTTLFTRAFALMAIHHPELRQRICDWPWARIYQKPSQGAKICVSRKYQGADWLFFFGINSPETLSLVEIQNLLVDAKTSPVENIVPFYQQTLYSRCPRFLRRFMWFMVLNFPGLGREASKGTFGVSSVASQKAISIHPMSAGHMVLTYAPIEENGDMRVTLVYDHRLFDGSTIANFLSELEETFITLIVEELNELCSEAASGIRLQQAS